MELDVAWLAAELPKRPRNAVPSTRLPDGSEDDEEMLSDEEKILARKMGLSEEEYLRSKKECGTGTRK